MEQEKGQSLYRDANFVFSEQHLMGMEIIIAGDNSGSGSDPGIMLDSTQRNRVWRKAVNSPDIWGIKSSKDL